jgi:hypothetical protein
MCQTLRACPQKLVHKKNNKEKIMDFLTDEDLSFEQGTGSKIEWATLFVPPLKTRGQSMRIRPVVSYNNDALYLKSVPVHKFLKAVGQAVCTNSKQNLAEGKGCPFCKYLKEKLNPIYVEMFYLLKELGYELPEGDLHKLTAALNDALKLKKSEKLANLKEVANKYEMSNFKFYNYLPVIDVTDPSKVKLLEHTSMIKKSIRDFHESGKDIKNFDIIIKRTEEKGNYYSVTREDQTELTESQKKIISDTLPEVEKALDVMFGAKASSLESNLEKFEKYSAKMEGREVAIKENTTPQSTPSTPVEGVDTPKIESFTVQPY